MVSISVHLGRSKPKCSQQAAFPACPKCAMLMIRTVSGDLSELLQWLNVNCLFSSILHPIYPMLSPSFHKVMSEPTTGVV